MIILKCKMCGNKFHKNQPYLLIGFDKVCIVCIILFSLLSSEEIASASLSTIGTIINSKFQEAKMKGINNIEYFIKKSARVNS